MKIQIFLPLIATIFNRFVPISRGSSEVPFDAIYISPLHYDSDSTVIVASNMDNVNFKVLLSNEYQDEREVLNVSNCSKGTHTFKLDNTYTRINNRIKVSYYSNGTWKNSSEIEMKVSTPKIKYITNNEPYTPLEKYKVLNSRLSWRDRFASYSFNNFDGLYIPSFYHKIDLADFEILPDQISQESFSCNPALVLKNVNGVFDDIDGANSSVEFNLQLVKTEDGYSFELADDLYVDKQTLLLSSSYKEGYVKTKYIYLPRNDMREQSNYDAYFVLEDFGINNDVVFHKFELKATKNIFGDCRNSEYCIQEEIL